MNIKIEAKKRDPKESVNALRNKGFIPAVLYGNKVENILLSVPQKEFEKIYKEAGESTMIEVVWDKEKRPVLIHDVQRDQLQRNLTHVDFYQVNLAEKITTEVELVFVGEAPAVKNLSGVLVKSVHEIEVEALPQDLPHNLPVDLSVLVDFEKVITVKDLEVPKGVKVLADDDLVIASVIAERAEEETSTTTVDVSAIKVEGEEKKKKREEEKSANAK